MFASEVLGDVRAVLAEPNSNGRWSDNLLLTNLSIAVKEVVRYTRFPESRGFFTTISGVQEYIVREQIRILRVYYAGQLLPRTDIPTMEGYQIQMYDNTAQGSGPGGLIPTDGASVLYASPVAPQWTSAAATAPDGIGGSSGFAQPYSQPWYPGRRPVYYVRGGNLGIVPPPAGAVPVIVDAVLQPMQIIGDSQAITLPDICRQALLWKTVYICYMSDRGQEAQALRTAADNAYQKELREVMHWAETYDGTSRGINVQTQRNVVGTKGNYFIQTGQNQAQ